MRVVSAHSATPPSARDLIPAPYLGALAAYAAAYLRGGLTGADAITLLNVDWRAQAAAATQHPFSPSGSLDLREWFQSLSAMRSPSLNLVLPEPGHIAGLPGPPAAIQTALMTGQAITILDGMIANHTVCADPPRTTETPWLHLTRFPAPTPRPMEVLGSHASGTREDLYRYLDSAHTRLQELDLVPDEPVRARTLPPGWLLMEAPPGLHPTHAHTARLAGRLTVLAEEALAEHDALRLSLSGEGGPFRPILIELRRKARATLQASLSHAEA